MAIQVTKIIKRLHRTNKIKLNSYKSVLYIPTETRVYCFKKLNTFIVFAITIHFDTIPYAV